MTIRHRRGAGPKVIKVPVNLPEKRRILDLTTDEGIIELLKKYLETKNLYGNQNDFLEINDDAIIEIKKLSGYSDTEKTGYIESLKSTIRPYLNFKWDCAVITQLVREKNYSMIIAVFQEGESIAYDVYNHKYEEVDSPSYQGIRFKDSLIACITDLDIIDGNHSAYEEVDIESLSYPVNFLTKTSSIEKDKM